MFAFIMLSMPLYSSIAAAQVSDDIVDATTGLWLVASEDGSPGCRLTLQKAKTIGGYALKEEKPCAGPLHDNVYSWSFGDGTLDLRDATRKVMMSFEEQEGGPWRTPEGITPRIYLIPEPGAMQSVPVAKNLLGTSWTLSDKKGKPLCGIQLSDRLLPDSEDVYALAVSKDCNAAVRKTKISMWQISEINLIFAGGEDWAFTLMLQPDGSFVSDDGKYKLVKTKQ
ncbi:protease inhibitor Inh/omp19 family protein [Rhizobium sp. XQZ8]|uniref:AprI/Inh family metalloprotease inhibitor n=1 Tax=Rhizobium populisoli TaxID=2859785 RepID=UPI001C66A54D|nr:AprI/Inh family metalloprotease inhibitor [Rhizobium populisoli]MBW6421822.1 protease inhibitor Inh/omp19 family protein [Rhizobium populisoli]